MKSFRLNHGILIRRGKFFTPLKLGRVSGRRVSDTRPSVITRRRTSRNDDGSSFLLTASHTDNTNPPINGDRRVECDTPAPALGLRS